MYYAIDYQFAKMTFERKIFADPNSVVCQSWFPLNMQKPIPANGDQSFDEYQQQIY